MNLLMLILIGMALIVSGCVFYVAWELSSDKPKTAEKKEPGEPKESEDSPSS
jgi:flagellar basal body-associated protein FliL